ncbi:MAG: RES domain-containing protein [Rubrobacteraceae bacterium]
MARSLDVFAPPDWSWAEEDGTFGNRFDDPGAYRGIPQSARFRVIYCATHRAGAFGETIARYRQSPTLPPELEEIADDDPDDPELEGGILPEEWRLERRLGCTLLDDDLLFADFTVPEATQTLTEVLASWLVRFRLSEFDMSVITSQQRRLTQEAARYVYELADSGLVFAGIRYLSRLNTEWELWAIFDDRMVHTPEDLFEIIRADDDDLMEAASRFDITIDSP